MGVKVSAIQKDVYYSFVAVFTVNKVKFSKGQLKKFVRVLFLHFPQTSPETVTEARYWDTVISKFTNLATLGDENAAKFLFWAQQF